LPIKPQFAGKIVKGEKLFEYRKRIFNEDTSCVIIYSSSPEKMIVGVAKVDKILKGTPTDIWKKTKKHGGITQKFFREYFLGVKKASAIELTEIYPLKVPLSPSQIQGGFIIPQSFCYVDSAFLEKVICYGNCVFPPINSKSVVFIGGIHGVGKTTICREISDRENLVHLVASELIKGKLNCVAGTSASSGKKVRNVKENQELLISALDEITLPGGRFMLDGHFVLFNKNEEVQKVPLATFEKIGPDKLVVITGETDILQKRLLNRDGKVYLVEKLKEMQEQEIEYASVVAERLGIPLKLIGFENKMAIADFINSKSV
jgi:adenylate kinase